MFQTDLPVQPPEKSRLESTLEKTVLSNMLSFNSIAQVCTDASYEIKGEDGGKRQVMCLAHTKEKPQRGE